MANEQKQRQKLNFDLRFETANIKKEITIELKLLKKTLNFAWQNIDFNHTRMNQFDYQKIDTLSLFFCQTNTIQNLNKTYRHKDSPTNVLSFLAINFDNPQLDQVIKLNQLGDIVFCPFIINQQINDEKKKINLYWLHLAIHSLLHLCDFRHDKLHYTKIMQNEEIKLLEKLGFNNPWE